MVEPLKKTLSKVLDTSTFDYTLSVKKIAVFSMLFGKKSHFI
jgi:hypothetical protein